MPRWKTSSTSDISGILKSSGLTDLFTAGVADLSGISGVSGLALGKLPHTAVIEVNESGVKASAGTVSYPGTLDGIPVFKMDRPYIYVIRDVPTGTILFMGRVVKPEQL